MTFRTTTIIARTAALAAALVAAKAAPALAGSSATVTVTFRVIAAAPAQPVSGDVWTSAYGEVLRVESDGTVIATGESATPQTPPASTALTPGRR